MTYHRPFSSVSPLFAAFLAFVLVTLVGDGGRGVWADPAEWRCPRCPICAIRSTPLTTRLRYCITSSIFASKREMPFVANDALRRVAVSDVEELLHAHVIGQSHITGPIADAVRRKLSRPSEPLVLHFAGDNGVGKTHTARLISLATSLRCAPQRPQCDAGDNLLVIAGTGFDGLPLAEARRRIVQRLTAHQARYPHGVVLLDDLTAMNPSLVTALAPLFGRAENFAEQPDDTPSLSQLTVIVTTDFGQQGRTWGKSLAEVEQMVRDEFTTLYGTLVPAFARTMVFTAFTRKAAEQMVQHAVSALPCATLGAAGSGTRAGGAVAGSFIDEIALSFLVERHREMWEGKENGHALRRAVEDTLVPLVLRYFDTHGHDRHLWARFRIDEKRARILLDDGNGVYDLDTTSDVEIVMGEESHPEDGSQQGEEGITDGKEGEL